jgi:hypothetical protein
LSDEVMFFRQKKRFTTRNLQRFGLKVISR